MRKQYTQTRARLLIHVQRAMRTTALRAALALSLMVQSVNAQPTANDAGKAADTQALYDPFDPFDIGDTDPLASAQEDAKKSADELLRDASLLLMSERPLDARTKLLRALQKDPNLYRTHYLLAGYYLVHVGHFRLALKYIKRAEELFEKQFGKPPYSDQVQQLEHSNILYYQSQIRLSLDNYKGALESLDRYSALGYVSEWYPGSRAWILMKLGDIQGAITIARAGILAGAEPGRTLNMLGILLSMNGQPQEALDVFRKAIAHEYASGSDGQPATPLNNAGEVYKELFDDDKAESSFLRATSLPDGCEHVLPSLNLVLLYIDQLKLDAASSTLDAFQRCIAQFPLRNNEEHDALVHLARGRIDLHSGRVDSAIQRFRSAMDGTQWFGKIGTNQNDLIVAATISLGQALRRKNNIIRSSLTSSMREWFSNQRAILANGLESWWLLRRARQMLLDDLRDVEDLSIRNTDSLLEYPTLGETLRGLSRSSLARRLEKESHNDARAPAKLFYQLYQAESELGWWPGKKTLMSLDTVIERARPRYDELLRTHATLSRMKLLEPISKRYRELAYRVFLTAPAELRNYGFSLPVLLDSSTMSRSLRRAIQSGPFTEVKSDSSMSSDVCTISAGQKLSAEGNPSLQLRFTCPGQTGKNRTVEHSDPRQVVNKLSEALFSQDVTNANPSK
jgi:tetratricopeptide (TPR) repeat protein